MLSGYFQGKRNAEHAMAASFPDTGVCLRPSFIHGTRYVSGSIGIPLSLIGELLACMVDIAEARSTCNTTCQCREIASQATTRLDNTVQSRVRHVRKMQMACALSHHYFTPHSAHRFGGLQPKLGFLHYSISQMVGTCVVRGSAYCHDDVVCMP